MTSLSFFNKGKGEKRIHSISLSELMEIRYKLSGRMGMKLKILSMRRDGIQAGWDCSVMLRPQIRAKKRDPNNGSLFYNVNLAG